jgi:hypothetical protein
MAGAVVNGEGIGMPNENARGYQVYVRVPTGDDVTEDDINRFLTKLAKLLEDSDKHVSVEPYVEDDPDIPKDKPDHKSEGEDGGGAGKVAYHAAGGHTSPLYPMYVCHNKF